jgi:transaldolase
MTMSMTQKLHDLGQSLWLDNITRGILDDGTLRRYIDQYAVTGLTSNPTIFDEAIGGSALYDDSIRKKARAGAKGEALFVDLALEDLRRAADLFRPIFDRTGGVDGWVSMEVSPLLADDTRSTIEAARSIHKLAERPNLYVKIPGTPAGVPAIEEAIFAGVPVNVTLLFSREQYLAVAEAYMRGLERRIAAKLEVRSSSSGASLFVSRWDKSVGDKVPAELKNRLGIAMAARAYKAHCDLIQTERWRKLAAAGAHAQRMLWASTGTKDPKASPTLYVEALVAPGTVDTMPEKTLAALAERPENPAFKATLTADGGDAEQVIARFAKAGVDVDALAKKLQLEGAESFVKSWKELMQSIADKSATLATT